jgi:hypothetical protein
MHLLLHIDWLKVRTKWSKCEGIKKRVTNPIVGTVLAQVARAMGLAKQDQVEIENDDAYINGLEKEGSIIKILIR